jgi:WD40 repeat protein
MPQLHYAARLASASDDGTVRIWNAGTGALQQIFKGYTSWISSVAFSQDGRRLALALDDRTVQIWDAETAAPQQTLEGHTREVTSIVFSHDRRQLASASSN